MASNELLGGSVRNEGREPPHVAPGSDEGGRPGHDELVEGCISVTGVFLKTRLSQSIVSFIWW